jgi:hypothetical protein
MSKAVAGHTMPENQQSSLNRRTAITALAGVLAASSAGAGTAVAATPETEWPEFREWNALLQEEERFFNRPDKCSTGD